jgi:excisionase family DNA binding protein
VVSFCIMTDETCTQQAINSASDGLLNKRGLAAKLNISKRTVDAWMKKRRLPFIKVGKTVRFRWDDVLEKLSEYRVN